MSFRFHGWSPRLDRTHSSKRLKSKVIEHISGVHQQSEIGLEIHKWPDVNGSLVGERNMGQQQQRRPESASSRIRSCHSTDRVDYPNSPQDQWNTDHVNGNIDRIGMIRSIKGKLVVMQRGTTKSHGLALLVPSRQPTCHSDKTHLLLDIQPVRCRSSLASLFLFE